MKRFVVMIMLMCLTAVSMSAQWGAGLRDTRYVNVNYTLGSWNFKVEHSVYAEKMQYQRVGASVAYSHILNNFTLTAAPYFTTLYNGDYQTFGSDFTCAWKATERFALSATVNPHYDTGFDYKTCFAVGAALRVIEDASLVLQYTTKPEYRLSEKRLRAGVRFDTERLWVEPLLSIPVEDGKTKSVRMAVSMGYQF